MPVHLRRILTVGLAGLCALSVLGCGDTVQDQPVASSLLERLVMVQRNPVYWLGGSFQGLQLSDVSADPGGAFTIQYGDCTEGGQNTCVHPLSVVTSPDNSFRPGGETVSRAGSVRGVSAAGSAAGRTIEIATGGVIVEVRAGRPRLAREAAETMVPINRVGTPAAPLPAALGDTGFAQKALPSQKPPVVQVPRPLGAGSGAR